MSLSFTLNLNLCCSIYAKCLESQCFFLFPSIGLALRYGKMHRSKHWPKFCASSNRYTLTIHYFRLSRSFHWLRRIPPEQLRTYSKSDETLCAQHFSQRQGIIKNSRSGNSKNLAPPSICEAQETERDDNVEPSDYSQPCEHRPDAV